MLYVISVSFILIPADEFPAFHFQLLTFPEIFNFSSFIDGLFPRPHCSDFFLLLSWLSPQSTGTISTGNFDDLSRLNLTALPRKFVLILAERDCQAQPLGVSEITLRSYGKIILGKLFKTNEVAVGESQILLFRFGVESQEEEMGMTRKISKSPPLHPPTKCTFLYCLCHKRFFILLTKIKKKIPANENAAYWVNIVCSSMTGSQATSYLLFLVGRAALSFVTYLSIMATHSSGKS